MSDLVKRPTGTAVAEAEQTRDCPVFTPRFDISENDQELTLWGDMPGVKPEDLDIQFEAHQLTIHGKVAPRQAEKRYLMAEYGVGDFRRTFTVGEAIDSNQIAAELYDGVLKLHLPKTEQMKARRIEVNTT